MSSQESGTDSPQTEEITDEDLYQSLAEYIESVLDILSTTIDLSEEDTPRPPHFQGERDQSIDGLTDREILSVKSRMSGSWEKFPNYAACQSSFEISDLYEKEAGLAYDMGVINNHSEKETLARETSLPQFLTRYLQKMERYLMRKKFFRYIQRI